MKLGFQEQNNGNGRKPLVTSDNLKFVCQELGIPDDTHTLRRAARAFDLYHSGKVEHQRDHTFKVASQYDRQEPYEVKIKQTPYLKAGGYAYCTCQDWMNYSGDQDLPDVNFWCKHSIAALVWLHNNNGNLTSRIVNECGTEQAKELQNNLNAQLDSRNDKGNGANNAPSQMQLDITDPFQEAEQLDIDQIEGRKNGELAWKLRSGEYVISYRGIMTLAEKHSIEFDEVSVNDNTVIAKAKNGNERISGKPIYDNATGGFVTLCALDSTMLPLETALTSTTHKQADNHHTAIELAKRNAARQLLPLPEIKSVEKKAQLEAEFNWQKAQAKCVELVGEANVSIIIHDLTQAGKLRQDNPSHYDRTEWLLIYNAVKKDASEARDPKSLNRWSYNSAEFLDQCREAIAKVRAEKKLEANDQPLENGNGKRKIQMDKKLKTWLVESDGTKSQISCREICEKFESKEKGIITRLRAGIDSGADISTVELLD